MDYDAASSKNGSKKRSKSELAIQAYLLKALQAFLAHLAINLVSGVRGNRNGRDALQVVLIAQAHRAATELSRAKEFILKKSRTKQLINFLSKSYKAEELKHLRSEYAPKFASKTFDLKRPKLDRQMKRRLKRVRSHEASRAITREKNLANNQFKILDVFRPLLYSWALIGSGESSEENPIYAAVVGAFKLLH